MSPSVAEPPNAAGTGSENGSPPQIMNARSRSNRAKPRVSPLAIKDSSAAESSPLSVCVMRYVMGGTGPAEAGHYRRFDSNCFDARVFAGVRLQADRG